jgi:tetratricopeptide (TPR) repeat protein
MAVTSREMRHALQPTLQPMSAAWRNWGDHPFVVIISVTTGLIGLLAFLTGIPNLPAFWYSLNRNPAAEEHMDQGNEYIRVKDYKRAIFEYTKAIEVDPSRPQYYSERGNAYIQEGKYDEAISDITNAINLGNDSVDTYMDRSLAYYKRGDPQSAINDLNRALRIDPENAKVYLSRGDVYLALGNYEQSILDYRECADLALDASVALDCIHRELEAMDKRLEAKKPLIIVGQPAPLSGVAVPLGSEPSKP